MAVGTQRHSLLLLVRVTERRTSVGRADNHWNRELRNALSLSLVLTLHCVAGMPQVEPWRPTLGIVRGGWLW